MGFIPTGFDIFTVQSPFLELWAALLGVIVGSFLNVVALRSLSKESLFWPLSKCPECKHRLGAAELIPIISYFALKGRCKHCQKKIYWHYPVVEAATALIFAVIVNHFSQPTFEGSPERLGVMVGMLWFASVLVAITVTDFREKLIPHEITYPSIVLGLLFSFFVRHDIVGALVGVGVSYILFDFMDFYGVKIHNFIHAGDEDEEDDESEEGVLKKVVEEDLSDPQIDEAFDLDNVDEDYEEEPFSVMGGGDAVLAAVMAAWLGWKLAIAAVVVGFMVGALMGNVYLAVELKAQGRLKDVIKPAIIGFLIVGGIYTAVVVGFATVCHYPDLLSNPAVWILDFIVAYAGTTLGVALSGNMVNKHFPFGPALAVGALYSVFLINLTDGSYIGKY